MALSRAKYRRLPDLYTTGETLVLKDGNPLWVQLMNPYEREEAAHDAQIARARMVMSINQGPEREKIVASMTSDGRDETIDKLVDYHLTNELPKIVDGIASDPEWSERMEILDRADDILATPAEPAETELLNRLQQEYLDEVVKRQDDERDWQRARMAAFNDEDLLAEYAEAWEQRRGADVARAEYALTEIWYAARVCEGAQLGDGSWDHSRCEAHSVRVFESKAEARDLPEDLSNLLINALARLNMTNRQARFLDSPASSSDSSPMPSEAGESTPSTPTETLVGAPGS